MNILQKIKNNELIPIGWGTGRMLQYRSYIHDFPLKFTIDTRIIESDVYGVKVEQPSILDKIDREKHLLIVYSVDFLNNVYEYCEKYEELLCLPFNSSELGIKENLESLKKANETFMHHGISYINIRKSHNASY